MRKTTVVRVAAAAAFAMTAAAAPAGAETVGTVASTAYSCNSGAQVVSGDGAFSEAGTVKSFRFRASSDGFSVAGARRDLQVLRPAAGGGYTVVDRVTTAGVPNDGSIVEVPASIPVQAGDLLGYYTVDQGAACYSTESTAGGSSFRFPATRPDVGDTITTEGSFDLGTNLQAVSETAPVAPLVDGHGVSGRKTRFDFTVTGTADAPTGTATLTSNDGKYIRAGDISCFRQIAPNRVIFGVRDTSSKTPATTYREFYAEDNKALGKDRLTELAKSSATAPPAGCRSKSPAAGAGTAIRSGDIAVGGYEPPA